MRQEFLRHIRQVILASVLTSGLAISGRAETPFAPPNPFELTERLSEAVGSDWRFANFQEPAPLTSIQPPDFSDSSPLTSAQPTDFGGRETSGFVDLLERIQTLSPEESRVPAVGAVGSAEEQVNAVPDLVALLAASPNVQTVRAQQRSPVSYDPRVRGYHWGQIYSQANGEYFLPVRQDLDTMLSKIDPKLISNVVVIPGPYGAVYGPAFAYIDVQTIDTPRYYCGREVHNRVGVAPRFNGGQLYAYDTVSGGSDSSGFIFSYGNRTGSDYRAGNGLYIPASYHDQNFLGQIGYDLTADSRLEFRYNRLDQTNVNYAAQIFDVDYLGTDSFNMNYVFDHPDDGSKTLAQGWYNRTRFSGSTPNASKFPFPRNSTFHVIDRIDSALQTYFAAQLPVGTPIATPNFRGSTNGDVVSTGARLMREFGEPGELQGRFGADVRYLEQHIFENFGYSGTIDVNNVPTDMNFDAQTNQPRSRLADPGVFSEFSWPLFTATTATLGSRVDWVQTNAQSIGGTFPADPDVWAGGNSLLTQDPENFPQNDVLLNVYGLSQSNLTENLTARAGVGFAERVPTLTERYADGVFMGIFQSGFSRIVGDPQLKKERALQIDGSVTADYSFWRGRASAFHSWVNDYSTYEVILAEDPFGARLLRSINTDLATLFGFETYGEVDLTQRLSLIAAAQYVEGTDQTIEAALPGIAPLEGLLAFRWKDFADISDWGIELGMRMVAHQHRVGVLRQLGTPGVVIPVESNTPGFSTAYLRTYYHPSDRFSLVAGIENLFDRAYIEHLNLRLPATPAGNVPQFPATYVFAPGITPYFGVEWVF